MSEVIVIASKRPARSCILTVNGGSSSLKFGLFEKKPGAGDRRERPLGGQFERVGQPDGRAKVRVADGGAPASWQVHAPDLAAAADLLISLIEERIGWDAIAAVGHRIVHGGPRYREHARITSAMLAELGRLSPFDPEHLPGEIALIERFASRWPELPQVACFDTAFHHAMPEVARTVPLPRRYRDSGVQRYGFHGLSYAYLMEELARVGGPAAASGRVILAHLGAGASMAAVHQGRPIDTTMGFTATSGLVMATRAGDLDPCLPWFLAKVEGMTLKQFHTVVNKYSGLLGVSEISSDMRDLLAKEQEDERAALAVSLFVYQAKKAAGALAAALGGLDVLVFAGGIGENSPETRARICAGLEFMGIILDEERNRAGLDLISSGSAHTEVRVIKTDEESVIARVTAGFLPPGE